MQNDLPILSLVTFSPLLGALLLCLFRDAEKGLSAKLVGLGSSLLTFALSLHLWAFFDASTPGFQFVEHRVWIPNLGISYHMGLDGFGLCFVLMTTSLMPLALLSAWNLEEKNWQFQVQALLMQTAMLGCFVALDAVLFYTFFEATLVPMYFLIGLWGGEKRIAATIKAFLFGMVGSLFTLASIIYTALLYREVTGKWSFDLMQWYTLAIDPKLQIWLFLGFAVAFAIKTPLFPFHTWLPEAYDEAPTVGSVLLAAVKMAPFMLFLRFALPLFPAGVKPVLPILMGLCLVGILYGGLVAMVQGRLKRLLGYSSVSHMGFIALGLLAFNAQGVAGGVLQIVNHTIVTGALFFCVGMLYERAKTQEIGGFGGVMHVMPIFSVFFLVFSLAAIGLPGLNGFVGEILIMLGAAQMHKLLGIVAAAGVIVAAMYMLRMFQRVMFGEARSKLVQGLKDLSLREIVVLLPLAVAVIGLGVYPQVLLDRINVSVSQYLKQVKAHQMQLSEAHSEIPSGLVQK